MLFEYKVIPAPTKGRKAPGVKGAGPRFAHAIEEMMNEVAADGWEYHRSDILPSEERQGLTSSHTVYRSVLVFRRPLAPQTTAETAPEARAPDPVPEADGAEETAPEPLDERPRAD